MTAHGNLHGKFFFPSPQQQQEFSSSLHEVGGRSSLPREAVKQGY
jgi:hypothetical protein